MDLNSSLVKKKVEECESKQTEPKKVENKIEERKGGRTEPTSKAKDVKKN